MRCHALDGGWGRVAVAAVAAGVMAAGSTSATVEVRGSLEGAPEGATVEVALVRAPTLYELFAAVLNDDPGGLYTVEATVQAVDGRYALEVADPGVRWVRVRGFGAASLARLLVGPETDTLLPPLEFQRRAFCTLTLEGPTSAWIVRGESPGDLGYSRSWTTWPPLRRLEAGRKTRYEFEAGRTAPYSSRSRRELVPLTIGAPGYEPAVVECEPGADVAVELRRSTEPVVEGVLRRDGSPVAGAILVREDGWPVGTTDALGRYRTPEGVYRMYAADGGLDVAELVGGVGKLAGRAPLPVAVSVRRIASSRDGSPSYAAVHWSSTGAPLALDRGRVTEVRRFLIAAGPGAARTTVLAEHFAPLTITWLAPPAALSLEPLLGLEGVVVDSTGAGVGGVEVSVDGFGARPMALSDGAGQFMVEVAEPVGREQLVARATGYREARRRLSDVLSTGTAQRIVLNLLPARAIRGRLVAAGSGGGIRGTVGLAREWGSEGFVGEAALWNLEDPAMLRVVSTDGDGVFRLDPVDESNVRLVAAAPGHGTVLRKLPEPDSGSDGHQPLGDVVLERETVLRGRVTDESGAPVADATVALGEGETAVRSLGRRPTRSAGRKLTAAADGRFRIGGLAHGDRLSLYVSAPGFVRASIPLVKVDAFLDAEEVEVRLREATELNGRVTDEVTGAGVEGVRVQFDQTVRGGFALARTDDSGAFRLGGLLVGTGVLTARADGYETLERTLAEPPQEPLELTLRPRPEIDVTGMVVRDGAPVAGASVSIGSAVSVTGALGRFLLKSAAGWASLECRVPGAPQTIRREVEVAATMGEVTIDVTPVVVRGRVIGPDQLPVSVAFVVARRGDGGWFDRRSARTGPEGEFELIVEPGPYVVSAEVDNADGPEVEVEVAAGSEPYVELTVARPGLLRVVVRGLDPAEAAEVVLQVETRRDGGGTSSRGMARATGGTATEPVFEMPFQQPEGTTTVIVAVGSTGRSRRAPLRMALTGVTEVEISFADETGLVEGTVTLDGWPLAGERVYVTNERRNLAWSVSTDHRGGFLIDGLRRGDEIFVSAVGESRRVRVAEAIARVELEARSAAVRGRLLDAETGLPAAGLRVSAVPAGSSGVSSVTRSVRRQTTTRTADDGSFVIDGLFAVRYRLEVRPPGTDLSAENVAGSSDVDLAAGDLDVTLAVRAPVDQ